MEPFTIQEMEDAAFGLKGNRAPGPDGIMPETAKLLVREKGLLLLTILNEAAQRGSFPRE